MKKKILEIGSKHNLLTILGEADPVNARSAYLCRCACGCEKIIQSRNILSERVKSCGCLRALHGSMHMGLEYKSYIGKRFDRLIVLEYSFAKSKRCAHLICRCDCGKEKIISARKLHQGQAKSCGCKYEETKQRFRDKKKNVM